MLTPPDTIMSIVRPERYRYPSSSTQPTSPRVPKPSRCADAVFSGVVVLEIATEQAAEPHLAGLALGHRLTPVIEQGQLETGQGLADAARPLEPLLGGDHRDEAALGAAVVLGDDRPDRLDHVPLQLGRTGGGAVDDRTQ